MHVSEDKPNLCTNNNPVMQVKSFGIYMDDNLVLKYHINYIKVILS